MRASPNNVCDSVIAVTSTRLTKTLQLGGLCLRPPREIKQLYAPVFTIDRALGE